MTPEEEAYAIAEQRIAEAKASGAHVLNLSRSDIKTGGDYFIGDPKLERLARIPPAVAELTGLTRLDLNGTQVSDLAPLAGLSGLHELDLDSTLVSDLAPLAGLSELQKLMLNGAQISDLVPLAGLSKLRELWLNIADVWDLAPLTGLSKLQVLVLNGTQVSDLTPLAGVTGLKELYLGGTPVSDLAPLAGLTELRMLWLDDMQVSDLSPLKNLRALEWGAHEAGGLSFTDCPNITDPVLRALAKKDNPERTVETLAYLGGEWAPDKPPLTIDDLPDQDAGLEVVEIDGRLDVREGAPTAEEAADPLRRKLHERLKTAASELARIAGNRYPRQAGRARALSGRLECQLNDLDLVDVYLDLEEIRLDLDGREAREGDDRFDAETVSALQTVVDVGGGLVLGTEAVDVLEIRRQQMRDEAPRPGLDAANRDIAERIKSDETRFGPRLREYLRVEPATQDDQNRIAVVRGAAVRNTLIKVGRFVVLAAASGTIGTLSWLGVEWVAANADAILAYGVAAGEGAGSWIVSVVARAQELAGSVMSSGATNARDPR